MNTSKARQGLIYVEYKNRRAETFVLWQDKLKIPRKANMIGLNQTNKYYIQKRVSIYLTETSIRNFLDDILPKQNIFSRVVVWNVSST